MATYLKIDRATGNVLVREDKDDPVRALNKPTVWLPLVSESRPSFNPSTEQIALRLDIPDLADLGRDVASDAVATEGFDVVALTAEETARREQARINAAIVARTVLLDTLHTGLFVPGQNELADQINAIIKD